jgi:DNA-binding transcriptional LysR family regulator
MPADDVRAPVAGPFAPASGQVRSIDRRHRNWRHPTDIHDLPGRVPLKNAALGQHRHASTEGRCAMTTMDEVRPGLAERSDPGGVTPQGVELRHLRYFVALADAGTFTHAAEQMFIAQPTLSQQIRRLEEMVGTPLLQRRREGVRLTEAGSVLLEESRTVLSRVDHGVSRTRQAAGLGRPRLRFAVPPSLPEDLAVDVTSRLRATAKAAGVDVAWVEAPLDGEFFPVLRRRVDAGLGWLTAGEEMPAALEVMSLGEFEPDVWLPPGIAGQVIGLRELADLDVVYGPRQLSPVTYDAWLAVLRELNPRFEFIDPPFRRLLPITLAFAASTSRPTAVLTGPHHRPGDWPGPAEPGPAAEPADLVRARIDGSPLTAAAALVWSGDLPRPLQQVLFDTADSVVF